MFVSEEENENGKMFLRFEPTKSTKGASKMRRDLINAEISNLRDLLPLPVHQAAPLPTAAHGLVLKCHDFTARYREHSSAAANIGFSKAINGFMMMMTQNGKLLYISENAAEYLGHSMEDLLIHGDSVYDIIDRQDHQTVQNELNKSSRNGQPEDLLKSRTFFCRMNVTRNARRQMRFGDQKVVLVRGHFVSYLPLCSRNEPVFLAACTPLAMPETRECVVHGATNVFTTIHAMDMKIIHVDKNGEWYLGWQKSELQDVSWYHLIHWENLREAQNKHKLITHSEQEKSSIMLLRMQTKSGEWIWVHAVLQVKENNESNQTIIVCTNQVLSDTEAEIMTTNSWLYHYYTVQNKPNFGLAFDAQYQKYCPNGTYIESSPSQFNAQDTYSYEAGSCEQPHPQHRVEASAEVPTFQQNPQCVEAFTRHTPNPLNAEAVIPQYLNEDRSQNFDRGPVDYSTHSPTSVTSGERSPAQYEYPHEEVAALGQVLYYPPRQGEKRKHDQLYPRPETYPQTLQIYYDVKPPNTTPQSPQTTSKPGKSTSGMGYHRQLS